jgi:hypothetical protein
MPVEVKLEGRALYVIYCDANRKPMGWGTAGPTPLSIPQP